jgi:ribosomal protein L11 methyltransferase
MEIGDKLVVAPAWETVETDKLLLKIDPGMAFGTGSHETTSLCLEYLQQTQLTGKKVMDVGCGSGILSQAAVLLGADSAIGCDIDEAAVTCAVANAKLNGLSDKTKYYKGDLLEGADGKYEIVIANIVADIVMALTKDIGKVITDEGIFISSGIIVERVGEVSEFISNCGFEILEIRERRGWAAILARRK